MANGLLWAVLSGSWCLSFQNVAFQEAQDLESPGCGLPCCPIIIPKVELWSMNRWVPSDRWASKSTLEHQGQIEKLSSRSESHIIFVVVTSEHPALQETSQVPTPASMTVTSVGFVIKDPGLNSNHAANWMHDFRQCAWPLFACFFLELMGARTVQGACPSVI